MGSMRVYLAGTGASRARVAAALVAFALLATLLAFEGLPGDSGDPDRDSLYIEGGGNGIPATVTATLGAAAGSAGAAGGGTAGGAGGGGPGGGDDSPVGG